MTSDPPRWTIRLILTGVVVLVIVVGVTLALGEFSTPGYAGSQSPDRILRAFLNEAPTPIPTPVAAACGVHIVGGMVVATDTVGIELSNVGSAATIHAITLEWPATNGALVEVRLGNRTIWGDVASGHSATIFPNRTEVLPTIKDEQTSLELRFSDGATDGRYIILLHLGRSCYTLFDSNPSAAQIEPCFATFDGFSVNEQEAALSIRNTTEEPLPLSRLLLFWPDDQATINGVWLDDNLVSGPAEKSPAEIVLPAAPGNTLEPGQLSKLRLSFDRSAPLVGYTTILQTNTCEAVFSNAEPPLECPVRQEGEWQVIDQTSGLVLQNLGEVSQPIERIWLTFPATNGALVDLTVNDVSVVNPSSGPFSKTTPASMTAGVDLLSGISLPPNSRSTLGFIFENDAAPQHYTVQVDFPNECRVVATTRTDDSVPCQVQVDSDAPIRLDGNNLWLAVHNTGEVQAELRAIQVDWEAQFDGALTGVALGDVPFWEGERTEGTATVTHSTENTVPAIEPGQALELKLTFANEVVPRPYVFRLDFAEGCQLSYATQPDLAMPTSVTFTGIIGQLPANVFDGVWHIRLPGDKSLAVQVTPQTVIIPPGLTPRVGDMVSVRALPTGTDEYLATQIRVFPTPVEPVQFSGVIEEVDDQPPPGYIIVQSVWVDIAPDTDIQGELHVGWLAEVEGDRRGDGTVLARSIRTTKPISNARRVDFEGLVEGWQEISDVETLWIVSGMRVVVNRDTTIHHGILPGEQPELNTEVRVTGDMVRAGTVNAIELWYGSGEETWEFDGFIRQLPEDPQYLGVWTIEDSAVGTCNPTGNEADAACKQVLVTDSTFLDISRASPAIGAPVQVRVRRNKDGNLEALWIKVLVED